MKPNKRIPRLRFPEFQHSGEWEVKKLGEVYEFKPTNSFSRDCLNYENGLVKNIHYGDIHTKFNTLFDILKEKVPFINPHLPIEKIKGESYCKEGDIIFADASEDLKDVGKSIEIINLNNEKVVSGLHTLLARQKENLLVIGFGGYLFKSEWVRKQIQKEAQGAKVFGISATRISDIKIKFPKNKSEQQKIASCLSSLDEVLAGERQKLALLQQHKKGLLQQLFPQKGQTLPTLRFKEFENSGEWEVKTLGEVGEIKSGLSGKSAEDFGEGALYVTYKQVFDSSKIDLSKCGRVRIKEGEKQTSLKKGDILFTTSSETPEELGFASVVLSDLSEPVFLNSFCFLFRLFSSSQLLPEFSRFLFRSPGFRSSVTKLAQGITRFNLSRAQFVKILIPLPSLPEQQKIASCLSSLDDLITAQAQKIELLEQHKKGLLQGLFPEVDDHE
jgi:type I restriction enzyme S subunit